MKPKLKQNTFSLLNLLMNIDMNDTHFAPMIFKRLKYLDTDLFKKELDAIQADGYPYSPQDILPVIDTTAVKMLLRDTDVKLNDIFICEDNGITFHGEYDNETKAVIRKYLTSVTHLPVHFK